MGLKGLFLCASLCVPPSGTKLHQKRTKQYVVAIANKSSLDITSCFTTFIFVVGLGTDDNKASVLLIPSFDSVNIPQLTPPTRLCGFLFRNWLDGFCGCVFKVCLAAVPGITLHLGRFIMPQSFRMTASLLKFT